MRAAGWISIPVTERVTAASARGTIGRPASCSAWETLCESSAWTPGQLASTSTDPTPRAAGSRSCAAATSRRISPTTRARVRSPSMDAGG